MGMSKKICSICNENKKKKKLLDGFVCETCLRKCGPFRTQVNTKKASIDIIRKAMMASQINTKRIAVFKPTKTIKNHISFDEVNRLWRPQVYLAFRYEDIISFETDVSKETVISGNAGKAVAGGLLFGGVGAVAGASGKRKAKEVITGCQIKIITRNELYPVVNIYCMPQEASEITAQLTVIVDSLKKPQHTDVNIVNTASGADEILKYKKLLDDGIITNEEFEEKKKQLLNL